MSPSTACLLLLRLRRQGVLGLPAFCHATPAAGFPPLPGCVSASPCCILPPPAVILTPLHLTSPASPRCRAGTPSATCWPAIPCRHSHTTKSACLSSISCRDAFRDLLAKHRAEGIINAATRWKVRAALCRAALPAVLCCAEPSLLLCWAHRCDLHSLVMRMPVHVHIWSMHTSGWPNFAPVAGLPARMARTLAQQAHASA